MKSARRAHGPFVSKRLPFGLFWCWLLAHGDHPLLLHLVRPPRDAALPLAGGRVLGPRLSSAPYGTLGVWDRWRKGFVWPSDAHAPTYSPGTWPLLVKYSLEAIVHQMHKTECIVMQNMQRLTCEP